jgi:hypothetical protein
VAAAVATPTPAAFLAAQRQRVVLVDIRVLFSQGYRVAQRFSHCQASQEPTAVGYTVLPVPEAVQPYKTSKITQSELTLTGVPGAEALGSWSALVGALEGQQMKICSNGSQATNPPLAMQQ